MAPSVDGNISADSRISTTAAKTMQQLEDIPRINNPPPQQHPPPQDQQPDPVPNGNAATAPLPHPQAIKSSRHNPFKINPRSLTRDV